MEILTRGGGWRLSNPAGAAANDAYVEAPSASLGLGDRVGPFRSYRTGLLLHGARKSVEPMAARMEPGASKHAPVDEAMYAKLVRVRRLMDDGATQLARPLVPVGPGRRVTVRLSFRFCQPNFLSVG
jgi:hypothetical protein